MRPALLLVAAFSRHEEALQWGRRQVEQQWGPIALSSPRYRFDQTTYYEATMGTSLQKTFWALKDPVDPASLAERKVQTNAWEQAYQQEAEWPETRPLNLDPGYLTEAKLILATTKDRDHRIYLQQGIFAEVTLYFHQGQWRTRQWTYPDYCQDEYHQFFSQCREYLRQRLRAGA